MSTALCLLIPAYRPAETLIGLLSRLAELNFESVIGTIVIVDDGSGAEFDGLFERAGKMRGVHLVRHAVNLGKGAALKTGFNFILTTWKEMAGVITADADGQHSADDILRVGRTLAENPQASVLGVRRFGNNVPLRSWIGNTATRTVTRIFVGLDLADTQTGLRGWSRGWCMASLSIPANGYDFEMESLVKGKSLGYLAGLRQIPIETIYTDGNRSSHFQPLRDSMRIYYVFLRYVGSALVTAVTDNGVFLLILSQSGQAVRAQIAGRVVAVLVSFLLARNVVFHSHESWQRSLLQFLLLVAVMGAVSYGMLQFLHTRFELSYLVSKLMAEGALFLGNFAIQRDFIFTRKEIVE